MHHGQELKSCSLQKRQDKLRTPKTFINDVVSINSTVFQHILLNFPINIPIISGSGSLVIMSEAGPGNCSVSFLDCRGYYDLAAEIVGSIATVVLLYWTINNYRELKHEKGEEDEGEYQHSLRRKIRISLMNIIFLTMFLLHILYSMVLFQVGNESGVSALNTHRLWYKLSEVVVIQLFNAVLLTVGWLYWKGLNSFYNIKELRMPLIYRNGFRLVFAAIYIYLIAVAIAAGILLFFVTLDTIHLQIMGGLLLASSFLSIMSFISFRLLYYKNIFLSVKLSKNSVRREQMFNCLTVATSFARISLCFLSIVGIDLEEVRKYEVDMQCHDMSPYHGIILGGITLFVDLLPSFIFTRIFTAFNRQRQRTTQSGIMHTLFSAQPSEFSSGIM